MRKDPIRVSFERGLNAFDPRESLVDGEAQTLQNWRPVGRALHPRLAWKAAGASPTGAPATMRGRGLFTRWYESGTRKLVLAGKDAGNAFTFYKTNLADPTAYTSYTQFDAAVAVAAAQVNDPVDFAIGASKLVYTNPGFTSGRLRTYDGTTAAAVAVDNIAGRFVVYHLSRFFTGGALVNPTYLRWSAPGDPSSWDTANDFVLVSQDDGEPIEYAVVWDRGLVVGKQHSLHFLSGLLESDFVLSPISDVIGCARGKSLIVAEDFGIFVLSLDGQVYLYDGASVHRVTRKLKVSPVTTYMNGAFIDGRLFVSAAGAGGTVHVYEPREDRWYTENWLDTPNLIQDFGVYDDRYLLATPVAGTARALSVRQEHGQLATGSYTDPGRDPGVTESFIAETGEIWPLGPFGKSILRGIYVEYRQWTGGTNELLTFTPVVDDVDILAQAKSVGGKTAAGVYADRLDFAAFESATRSGKNIGLKITSTPTSSEAQTYSILDIQGVLLSDEAPR